MNDGNFASIEDTFELFSSESVKLQNIVNESLKSTETLSLAKIVETYYQIINVTSLGKFLKQNIDESKEDSKAIKVKEIENYVDKNFNSNLHLLIMSKLKNSTEDFMKELKKFNAKNANKTKEMVENQAKMYEELRKIMSTKEFVEQYDKELRN